MIPYAPFDDAFGEDVTIDGSLGRAIVSLQTPVFDGDLDYTYIVLSVSADPCPDDSPMMVVGSAVVVRCRNYEVTRRIDDSDAGWARYVLAEVPPC